jgi:hypothetical protein
MTLLLVALAIAAPATKKQECNTHACLRRTCHSWACQRRILPHPAVAMLARLRGCETRGIPYPKNYRWKGHHRGAYQYDFATWKQAGGHGDPAEASPAEQDVRTARFYPRHRSQWQCRA